jgi:ATPase, P-type (transporting), HAD superfamily, subfamily IC
MNRSTNTAIALLKMRKGFVGFVLLQIFLISSSLCGAAQAFRLPRSLGIPKFHSSSRNDIALLNSNAVSAVAAASIRGGSSDVSRENPIQVINRYETVTESSTFSYNQTSVEIGSTGISSLLHHLSTSVIEGLSSQEASSRLVHYGPNVLETPPSKSLFELILEQFDDKLVQILLCVAVISGIFSFMEMRSHSLETDESQNLLKSFMEPIVILAILVLNAAVGVWQSRQAEGSLDALKKLQPSLTCVLRDGKWLDNMEAKDLVPGDIIRIRVGDKVPADARVLSLESSVLNLDEGSLTGESVTVEKVPGDEGLSNRGAPVQDMKSVLFSGTVCTAGSAVAVVVRTGMATEMGKIQKGVTEAKADEHKTPLGIKLDEFGHQLTKIIGFICLGVWCVSIPKFTDPTFKNPLEGAVYYAKVAVALGVAAIPEGLPAVITLCLSLGTRRMAKRNVIVRKLPSVETLGCTR